MKTIRESKVSKSMNPIKSTLRSIALVSLLALPLSVLAAEQKTFPTPEAAVDALQAALKANDQAALIAIFGDRHTDAIGSDDPAQDAALRAKAAAALETYRLLEPRGDDRRVLLMGERAWPLPIPLVKTASAWRFATEEGVEELINRRIGGNERSAIEVMRAYVDAQRQYAARDRDGDGVLQYAQRLVSSEGRHDGLYWPADPAKGEESSPFGPLIGASGYDMAKRKRGDPYRGYHFRILTRQGKGAPGGAYSYVINGRMIAGFALIAYPHDYGRSGVMSFIVSHNGKVYEKNLGPDSEKLAIKMTAFDPTGWKEVAP